MFEIKKTDLAGRIGLIKTKNGIIETPVLLPVIHPLRQQVSTKLIKKIGFNAVMTNAYLTLLHHGEKAIDKGIHNIINFEGPKLVQEQDIISVMKKINADGIGAQNHKSLNLEFYKKIKKENKKVHVWTVNSKEEAKNYWLKAIKNIDDPNEKEALQVAIDAIDLVKNQ